MTALDVADAVNPGQIAALAAMIAGTVLHLTAHPEPRHFPCGGVLDREPQERELA